MQNDSSFRELRSATSAGERIIFVHYSCGSFYDYHDQPTPIVCIATVELGVQGQDRTYSIIDAPQGADLADREKDLIARFYDELRAKPDARVVHWNMNSSAFGFSAIAARYRYLHGKDAPDFPVPDRRFDLDDIIALKFGKSYASHPKLRQLCILNSLFMPHFMLGKAEAGAIARQEYGAVVNSTVEKAHLISELFRLLCAGRLKTLNSVGWVNFAGEQIDAVSAVLQVGERLRQVHSELSARHSARPTIALDDEYDAQDLFRGLLRIFFDDIREEDPTSRVAGAATRIDFTLPGVGLAVELKYTRPGLDAKKLGEELIVDKARYQSHGKIGHLIFLVFDKEARIRNPKGIEADLSRDKSEEDFAVTVRIIQS